MENSPQELLRRIIESLRSSGRLVSGPDSRGEYTVWCPFHDDGKGKPPHAPNLRVSERGFICYACGAKGGLPKLAKHLGIGLESSPTPEATYVYRDEKGQPLFRTVRMPGKRFFQQRYEKGAWVNGLRNVHTVPYHLPELLAKPQEIVFVVEGEKDADNLSKQGVLATTNPCGAGKWRSEYNVFLKDRDVVILPDNDSPGKRHAAQVAQSLQGTARSIKVIELPGLKQKEDVTDWLQRYSRTVEELKALVEKTPVWTPTTEGHQEVAQLEKRSGKAVQIVDLILGSGIELFHDERSEPHAVLILPEGRRILPVRSQDFRAWVAGLTWKKTQYAPSREVLGSALEVISAKARFDSPEHKLHVRVAWHENAIWVDLDGRRAVRVTSTGWEIVKEPPILFRSFPHQKPMPEPAKNGDIRRVLDFVNLRDEGDKLLLLCYLVTAFVPDIPICALIVHGVQGSAKTSFMRVVKKLLDPGVCEVHGGVKNPQELAQALFRNRVLFLDNFTHVPDWLSDGLCCAVTGAGNEKRALWTNEDSVFFEYKRVVGLNGINLVADRADLLDRSIILALEPVAPDKRRKEHEFWEEFDTARPVILGGIFDALSKAMKVKPTLDLPVLPRMADFAEWGAAVAVALGKTAEEFLAAYDQNVGRQNEAAIEASPVAQAALSLMENKTYWSGTSSELLDELTRIAEQNRLDTRSRQWAQIPAWLTRRLKEVRPNLLAMGIAVEIGVRKITLRKDAVEVEATGTPKLGLAPVEEEIPF